MADHDQPTGELPSELAELFEAPPRKLTREERRAQSISFAIGTMGDTELTREQIEALDAEAYG